MSWIRRSGAALGPLLVLTQCLINAVKSVVEGSLVQTISPEFLAFNYFLVAQVFYLVANRDRRALVADVRRSAGDVAAYNITTTLSWLGALYALQMFEPAIVNAVIVGAIPAFTIVLSFWLRPAARVAGLELAAAMGVLAAAGYLMLVTEGGLSAMSGLSGFHFAFGLASCAITAAAIAGNTHYAKRLSERGMTSGQMMACRFPLLIASSLTVLLLRRSWTTYTPRLGLIVLAIAVVGIIFALWALQIGIARTEPVTVSLLFGSNLVLTYLIQFFDPRLRQSGASFLGIAVLTAFIMLGAWARYGRRIATRSRPAGVERRGEARP